MHQNDRRHRFAAEARAERPELGLLCLLVAAEADPALDEAATDRVSRELDRLAAEVAERAGHGAGTPPEAWADALREVLATRYGFQGRTPDYDRLSSSLLPEVLRRRRGLPILLSVVWIEVGRRAGAPVYGVALPGHFVVGIGDPDGRHVLADPFHAGRALTLADAEELVARATGASLSPLRLPAAEPLDVITRVLNNIRSWAAARPDQTAVQLWAVELSLLLPSHPARLRLDRAQLLVERGDFTGGAAEMDSYAEMLAAVDPAAADAVRRQARSARALLN